MNKSELASLVADKAGLTKAQGNEAVDAMIDVITKALRNGDDVRLTGFGTFATSKRKASVGRNPATGAEIQIPERTVPKFAAGKSLKDAVAG